MYSIFLAGGNRKSNPIRDPLTQGYWNAGAYRSLSRPV